MRAFIAILVVIGALWAIDVVTLDGRYSDPVWHAVKQQAHDLNDQISRWLSKLSP